MGSRAESDEPQACDRSPSLLLSVRENFIGDFLERPLCRLGKLLR
jgi:hypothetical protein